MRKLVLISIVFGLASLGIVRGETIVALTSGNRLLFFDSATPGTVTKTITINTVGNEALVAIDFRPLSGELYAMGVSTRFYVLNLTTGAASSPTLTPKMLAFQ